MKLADVVFISKDYARSQGCKNAQEAVINMYKCCKQGATLICAWGEKGASLYRSGMTFTAPAKTDIKVVDTLGAGDTFNAGFISHLVKHEVTHGQSDEDLQHALTFACQLAGFKCSKFGYADIKSFNFEVI